jgi:hypothetical protein
MLYPVYKKYLYIKVNESKQDADVCYVFSNRFTVNSSHITLNSNSVVKNWGKTWFYQQKNSVHCNTPKNYTQLLHEPLLHTVKIQATFLC